MIITIMKIITEHDNNSQIKRITITEGKNRITNNKTNKAENEHKLGFICLNILDKR